jgi:D-sedoheptulose 7-phosphate isomerase
MTQTQAIDNHFVNHIWTIQQMQKLMIANIKKAVDMIVECYQQYYTGKVVLFGNGGSAADAQHIAAEMVGRFKVERGALPAIALTTDTSIITAVGNDYGFDCIFERQVEAFVDPGNVVIGISTSGNSANVIKGIEKAAYIGAHTIGLTGGDGGALAEIVDVALIVPSHDTPIIQEAHIIIGHIICDLVEGYFCRQTEDENVSLKEIND